MRRHAKALSAVAALCSFLALGATPALAAHGEIGSFAGGGSGEGGAGSEDGQLLNPGQIDVLDSSGAIYVADTGNDRVQVFTPTEAAATFSAKATVQDPTGLAIDQATGSVYVANATGIAKLNANLGPAAGWSDPGVSGPLAVDPSTGDLLVADTGANLIRRFEADGTADGSFAAERPVDVAADSTGDVLVVTSTGNITGSCGPSSKVVRFSGAGVEEGVIGPSLEVPGAVAVDPDDDSVAIAANVGEYFCEHGPHPRIAFFDSTGTEIETLELSGDTLYAMIPGLAAVGAGSSRIYAVTKSPMGDSFGNTKVTVLEDLTPPEATIDPVDTGAIAATEATFSGSVDPNGKATEYHFEYSSDEGASWISTPSQSAGSGEAPVAVGASASGLTPNTGYEARLVAVSAHGSVTSAPPNPTFTTDTAPPTVITQEAVSIGADSAWLRGSVNPRGLATTYYFEYGTNTSYGARVPLGTNGSAGQGQEFMLITRKVIGLRPATTYHYRIVAENGVGVSEGADATFTTKTGNEPAWAYEMVSPPEKNGTSVGTVDPAASGGAVSVDGNAVGFMSPNAFPGSVSSGFKNWYASFRGSDSWLSKSVNPPFRAEPTGGGDGPIFAGASEDLTKTLVFTNVDPITQELQPRRNLYLHDLIADTYVQLTPDAVTGPQDYIPARTDTALVVRAATPSLSHVLIAPGTEATLTPDAGPSSPGEPNFYLVDTATGEITFLTRGIDRGDLAGGSNHHAENVISEDGSIVFLDREFGGVHRFDLRTHEDDTVNAAEGTGEPLGSARFLDASRDGRYVFFYSGQKLTPSDSNEGTDIYRYDADASAGSRLTLITVDSEPADGATGIDGPFGYEPGSMGVSWSGDRLYFRTGEQQLVAGGPTGPGAKLYLWDGGTVKYIATDPEPPQGTSSYVATTGARRENVSVDQRGNYLTLVSGPSLALPRGGFDPCPLLGSYGCRQVYLYDAEASTPTDPDFTCVSCLAAPHKAPWSAGFLQYDGTGGQWVRSPQGRVSDDGSVLFATATPLLPGDLNGPGRDYDNSVVPNIDSEGQDVYLYRQGELELVSTGRSLKASFPLGISRDGKTVAFSTKDRLSGWDTDELYDVYVARLGGGLPEPPPPPFECEGDACLNPVTAPNDPTPASAGFSGAGNPRPVRSGRPRCSKGKKRVHGRCVKRKSETKKPKQRAAGETRRAHR